MGLTLTNQNPWNRIIWFKPQSKQWNMKFWYFHTSHLSFFFSWSFECPMPPEIQMISVTVYYLVRESWWYTESFIFINGTKTIVLKTHKSDWCPTESVWTQKNGWVNLKTQLGLKICVLSMGIRCIAWKSICAVHQVGHNVQCKLMGAGSTIWWSSVDNTKHVQPSNFSYS